MLVDLKALDVVVGQGDADGGHDDEDAHSGLCGQSTAKGSPGDHECADVADDDEGDDEIAVDAVGHQVFMADDGYELPDHEETGGEDGGEVDGDANAMDTVAVPIPFAGRSTVGIATAGGAGDVQIGKTGEREAHDDASEDDD